MSRSWVAPVLFGLILLPAGIEAQSLGAAEGLGSPIEALDARSRALGGVGIGLRPAGLSMTDPAAMADLFIPSLDFSLQTSWVNVDENGNASEFTGTRFPVLGVTYPIPNLGVFSLAFGTVMDQGFTVTSSSEIALEGTGSRAKVTDEFFSEGGIAALRLGFARRINPTFAVGGTIGSYTGDVTRAFTRTFDSLLVETSVPDFTIGGQWRYSGIVSSLGASADLAGIIRLAGSVNFGGTLDAKPTDDTEGGASSFSMPTELRVGASGVLSDRLSLNVGMTRADWSAAGEGYTGVDGHSVTALGAGLELSGASVLGKTSALRLGYHSSGLPFGPTGLAKPKDSYFAAGLGMDLLTSGAVVMAGADFSLERGTRDIGTISENYWRFAVSVRMSGF